LREPFPLLSAKLDFTQFGATAASRVNYATSRNARRVVGLSQGAIARQFLWLPPGDGDDRMASLPLAASFAPRAFAAEVIDKIWLTTGGLSHKYFAANILKLWMKTK
jgi:hypothetical protein